MDHDPVTKNDRIGMIYRDLEMLAQDLDKNLNSIQEFLEDYHYIPIVDATCLSLISSLSRKIPSILGVNHGEKIS